MQPNVIRTVLLLAIAAAWVFQRVLAWLNIAKPRETLDPRLAGNVDEAQYQKSVRYQRDRTRLALVSSALSTIVLVGLLATGLFGRLDSWLAQAVPASLPRALLYFAILGLGSELLGLPFELYHTFRLEARYGFNRSTPRLFLADKLKTLLLGAFLGGAALSGLIVLVDKIGPNFWLWFSLIAIAFVLFLNMFYTSLIVPLFNKLKPLDPGPLREAIETYAGAHNFRLHGIYISDASKRSTKANAYFSGLGPNKKIVLFDTLVEAHPADEVVAILAHEVGHSRHRHILKGFAASALQIVLVLWLFSLFAFAPELSRALGSSNHALHLNLLAFALVAGPVSIISGIPALLASRRFEYQADAFAARTTSAQSMSRALIRLSAKNLSYLYPHPWFVFFNYSHPPLLARLDALEGVEVENLGFTPRLQG